LCAIGKSYGHIGSSFGSSGGSKQSIKGYIESKTQQRENVGNCKATTHDYKFLAELKSKKCRLDAGKDPEVRMLVFGDGDIHIQVHCYDGGEVYETSEPIWSRGTKGYAGD